VETVRIEVVEKQKISYGDPVSNNLYEPTILENFKAIHHGVIPTLVSCVISEMQLQLNLLVVGNYIEDTSMLVGVGMANMIINVGCMSIVYGMVSVLETLVS
jgi:hypothetical protein